jgi:hypothetical protein
MVKVVEVNKVVAVKTMALSLGVVELLVLVAVEVKTMALSLVMGMVWAESTLEVVVKAAVIRVTQMNERRCKEAAAKVRSRHVGGHSKRKGLGKS